ncbi:MAG: ABC transporter permease [Clostridiales bacterium]|nr:ABC transporter permease [Clostridiales bacterium]
MTDKEQIAEIIFRPDDFLLKGADETKLDMNFASQRFWKDAYMRFRKNKGAVFSLIMILLVVLLAIFGPLVSNYTYQEQNIAETNMAPRIPLLEDLGIFNGDETLRTSTGSKLKNAYVINKETGEKKDTYYWLGSDALGRDIWTRTWTGTRISLYIAIVAVLIDMLIGMSYGLISGYFGGKVDSVMQRFAEIVNSIPTLVIVTLLMLILKPGLMTITIALMITGWIGMSRIARAQMLKLKEQEFVLASHTLGASNWRVIFSEILPNIIGQLITNTMFSIPNAIFTEAFLSFVGLGIPEPMCSLGSLISYAFKSFTTHPFQIVPPVIVLALLMLCFNMLADGLRDAFDPKMKEM